jgi:dihydroorotate dehydrogenase
MLYRLLYAHVLSRFDAESVHTLTVRALGRIGRIAPGPAHALLRALAGAGAPDPRLRVRAFGLEFPSPLGVAAGLDKNLDCFEALGALGFGYVEIGTVTAEPQAGNPRPRIFRLPADRALLNSMGFPNHGAQAAAQRLQRPRHTLVAVNIGRSKVATDAAADYRRSVLALAPHADLLVLNVSSPNTPGLRDLQAVDVLRDLVESVRAALRECGADPPLLVKIAPDLDDQAVDAIADAALELSLDGLVCTNTTVTRAGLASPEALTARPGGVSGAPLKRRSLEVLRRVRARVGDRVVLVSVGGVEGPDDALARIRAGATLVQAYTAFVYGGPGWPAMVNRGLLQRLESVGAASVQEMVGTEAPAAPTAPAG